MNPSKAIGLLAYDDMQALDLTGPLDVFGAANALASGMPPYELHVIGVHIGAVHAENGLAVLPAYSIEDAPPLRHLHAGRQDAAVDIARGRQVEIRSVIP